MNSFKYIVIEKQHFTTLPCKNDICIRILPCINENKLHLLPCKNKKTAIFEV
jgi:hypothetical protein